MCSRFWSCYRWTYGQSDSNRPSAGMRIRLKVSLRFRYFYRNLNTKRLDTKLNVQRDYFLLFMKCNLNSKKTSVDCKEWNSWTPNEYENNRTSCMLEV